MTNVLRHSALLLATLAFACSSGEDKPAAKSALNNVGGGAGSSGSGGMLTTGGSSGSGGGNTGGDSGSSATGGSSGRAGAGRGGAAGSATSGTGGGSDAGAAGETGTTGGTGGTGIKPPPPPVKCEDNPQPSGATPKYESGRWVNISPPGLYRPGAEKPSYGCMDIQVSPCNPYLLYLTTDVAGMWRSTDGGATWNMIGDLPEPLSPGVLAINPKNALQMYYGGGVRGASVGFWISNDGGDHWEMPEGFAAKANNSDDGWVNDVYEVKADPENWNHILLSFHSGWAFKGDAGVLESKDGGNTWIRHLPKSGWGAGHTVWFLRGNSETWLLGTQNAGYWRTTDSAATWTQVDTQDMQHGGTSAYYAKDGTLYVGALYTILRSEDNGETFTHVAPQTGDGYYAIIGDGDRMYTARGNTGDSSGDPDTYYVSDESDGKTWEAFNDQTFRDGPYRMALDKQNGIIYSANWNSGVWALKIAK